MPLSSASPAMNLESVRSFLSCRGDPMHKPINDDVAGMDLICAAREIAATLVSRQEETEQRTFYAEDTHEAFQRAGFYRMLVPRKFGGLEVDLKTFHCVITEISSGCPSSGWQLCLSVTNVLALCSMYGEDVQAELFKDGDFLCATTLSPQGTARLQADGSWIVNGTFNYASGIPYASHFMSHAIPVDESGVAGPMLTFLAPRSQFKQLHDWTNSLGLKGSGSHSVEIKDARIPARYVMERCDVMNVGNDGAPRFTGPDDRAIARHGRILSQFILALTAVLTGMLKGAVTEYARLMTSKKTSRPPIVNQYENEDYQRWYGIASGRLNLVEIALAGLSEQWSAAAERSASGGAPFSAEEELRIISSCFEVMRLTWDTVHDTIWTSVGTSQARDGTIMQRIYRDISTWRTHVLNSISDHYRRELARATFSSR